MPFCWDHPQIHHVERVSALYADSIAGGAYFILKFYGKDWSSYLREPGAVEATAYLAPPPEVREYFKDLTRLIERLNARYFPETVNPPDVKLD